MFSAFRRNAGHNSQPNRMPFMSNMMTLRHSLYSSYMRNADGDFAWLENQGKCLLPSSYLAELIDANVPTPYIFRVQNTRNSKDTYVGVQEFSAPEGFANIPQWRMDQIGARNGEVLDILPVNLPKASFIQLQAQSCDYVKASNHKLLLEHALPTLVALRINEIIPIFDPETQMMYQFKVTQLRPAQAVSLIDTDCELDFAEPVGYEEWVKEQEEIQRIEEEKRKKIELQAKEKRIKELQRLQAKRISILSNRNTVTDFKSPSSGPKGSTPQSETVTPKAGDVWGTGRVIGGSERSTVNQIKSPPLPSVNAEKPTESGKPSNPKVETRYLVMKSNNSSSDNAAATASTWGSSGRTLGD